MEGRKAQTGSEKSQVNLSAGASTPAVKPQISVFLELIAKHYGDNLRWNEMTGRPEWYNRHDGHWQQWVDVDDARMAAFFQTNYGLYSPKMLESASMMYFAQKRANPLTAMLETLKWDGKPRIETFLVEALQCEDTPYIREVSRLIFAGGIHRAYRPGCKFDDMVVLVGKQGGGKSSLVRWLNIDDDYFREIKTISGKEGVEALRGVWIGEVAELMAVTRMKESEAVKAFITAQEDSYRAPYARHVETIPRRCIFIGTTNDRLFLSDKTGNRRFYPVYCREDGYDLLARETEIREMISQCWAEALALYRQGKLPPYARRELLGAIREAQSDAEEDDWRVGAIIDYLDTVKREPNAAVCVIELWHRALGEPEESKPKRADSKEIGKIMDAIPGWERNNRLVRVKPWGVQRVWQKSGAEFYPF